MFQGQHYIFLKFWLLLPGSHRNCLPVAYLPEKMMDGGSCVCNFLMARAWEQVKSMFGNIFHQHQHLCTFIQVKTAQVRTIDHWRQDQRPSCISGCLRWIPSSWNGIFVRMRGNIIKYMSTFLEILQKHT